MDWRILPILSMLYSFAMIDRINLGAAYTAGMGADLVGPLLSWRPPEVLIWLFHRNLHKERVLIWSSVSSLFPTYYCKPFVPLWRSLFAQLVSVNYLEISFCVKLGFVTGWPLLSLLGVPYSLGWVLSTGGSGWFYAVPCSVRSRLVTDAVLFCITTVINFFVTSLGLVSSGCFIHHDDMVRPCKGEPLYIRWFSTSLGTNAMRFRYGLCHLRAERIQLIFHDSLAIFSFFTILAGGLSPLLAYGCSRLNGKADLAGWRWIFVGITVFSSIPALTCALHCRL